MQTADYYQLKPAQLAELCSASTHTAHQAAEAERDRQGKVKPMHTQCSA